MSTSKTGPLFWAAALALLVKLLFAFFTVGTNDSLTWEHDLAKLRNGGFARLYSEGVQYSSPSGSLYPTQAFIHPPPMVTGLRGLGMLQDISGLPIRFWMRFICAISDIGTLFLIGILFNWERSRSLLLLLALSPVSILISGFHANTDPIMIFCLVLSIFLIGRGRIGWAGAVFAVALGIKLVPIIFAPAILLNLPSLRHRVKWAGVAAVTWTALSIPYLVQAPALILKTMFAYQSSSGLWGFLLLATLLKDTPLGVLDTVYAPAAKWIAVLAAALLPLALRYLRVHLTLFVQCGLIVFLFLFLSPGFGLQYLAWTVPWVVALGLGPAAAWFAVAGACIMAVYLQAAGHIGVNAYADVLEVPMAMRIFVRAVCWLAVGAMVGRYARLAAAARLPRPRLHDTPKILVCGSDSHV